MTTDGFRMCMAVSSAAKLETNRLLRMIFEGIVVSCVVEIGQRCYAHSLSERSMQLERNFVVLLWSRKWTRISVLVKISNVHPCAIIAII